MSQSAGPNLFIIAGCNGAGKTTASFTILPELLNCREFVNADEIAKGLSPFQPESVAFEAGRIMLERVDELLHEKVDFAFETTLSTKTHAIRVKKAKASGYNVKLVFFWLKSPSLAKRRVQIRVSQGGHNIPSDIIERRYKRGIENLFAIYFDICDEVLIFDNSEKSELIAIKSESDSLRIINENLWQELKKRIPK